MLPDIYNDRKRGLVPDTSTNITVGTAFAPSRLEERQKRAPMVHGYVIVSDNSRRRTISPTVGAFFRTLPPEVNEGDTMLHLFVEIRKENVSPPPLTIPRKSRISVSVSVSRVACSLLGCSQRSTVNGYRAGRHAKWRLEYPESVSHHVSQYPKWKNFRHIFLRLRLIWANA
ncbi:hypothetical protein K474DRAFT_288836 [Panus rudis PR-1116 ss-1]|nr:hypothetical protein K474DRAFT_288836 [Panus rudis PR-1116 ss-1]